MHPDRDYYPTQLQNLWGAPNWGLKFSNLWLSCVDKFQAKSGSSLSVWLWFKRDETLANSSIKQSTQQSKAKPSQATGGKKEQRERTQVRARKKDMMFGIKRRFTRPENLPVKSTKVEMGMFGIKRRFLLAWRIYPSSTKVEICSACFIYLLFVT